MSNQMQVVDGSADGAGVHGAGVHGTGGDGARGDGAGGDAHGALEDDGVLGDEERRTAGDPGRGASAGRVAVPGAAGRTGGRPTMKDVASRAGVALKTVSRVVNREPGVTPETAGRVLAAIKELGFRRNESARLLRTGHTATLGFIAGSWTEPDHVAVYQGVESIAREQGYLMYSGSTDSEPSREEGLALAMCARRVDGLVIIPAPGSHDYLVSEIEAGVATVFVLRSPELGRADAVLPDARGAAQAAITHLAAHGHQRIGFVGGPAGEQRTALRDGYAQAMAAAGLPADPAWQALEPAALAGQDLPVTAVFCASQALTRAALRALAAREDGPSAGPRVAIIGFGDFEGADVASPPVTVVSYDPVGTGRTAGELLLRRLAGQRAAPSLVEVPVRLVARGSAEFPPSSRSLPW
jgi:LacI family transcriptional regulator